MFPLTRSLSLAAAGAVDVVGCPLWAISGYPSSRSVMSALPPKADLHIAGINVC
jgi:hypothetical protein